MSTFHTPVMLAEVTNGLKIKQGKKYIDATVGGGGHAVEIVKKGGILLGIDADRDAIEFAREELSAKNPELKEGRDWKLKQGNFKDIVSIAKENGFENASGILFDLGVSSHELDTPERGFSYRFTGAPLDLRLNQKEGVTAAQLVNQASYEELYDIFARFSEEELAWPIARAILSARAVSPITKTGDLVTIIEGIVRDPKKRTGVLSRVFQGLRIGVNEELEVLRMGIEGAEKLLVKNGRLVVITFHSLEDRIVKRFIHEHFWKAVTKKPMVPTREERKRNPRARSAKLRIAQKL